jgi:hypothetical protein
VRARRSALVAIATLTLFALAAPPALAVHSGAFVPPLGLFGISVSGILKTIARLLFSVLAGAFLPSWLRHTPGDALRWLIALPDPANATQWPTMHRLERDTTAVAVAFLPLTFAVAVLRYTASGVTGGVHHPAESIGRIVGAAAGLLLLPWAFANAVAAVNVTTSTLLSFASIDHGLQRALALMFAGGIAFGVTGPVVALLVIAAILLAVGLLMIKVGVLALFAILYVSGPLALALSPVPELHGAWRAWLGMLVALALIPIGWCLIFAVAGAISADLTHIGTPAAIGTRLVAFFAGVLTFFIAFRWPFFLIGMVRARGLLSGEILTGGAGGVRAHGGSASERVRQSRAALLAGAGAAGSAISQVGGALGAPAGGLAGASARAARGSAGTIASMPLALRGRQGLASSWQALRVGAAGSRAAHSPVGRRLAAAGAVAGAAPAAIRAAVSERDSPRGARAAADQVLATARARTNGAGRTTPGSTAPTPRTAAQPGPTNAPQPRSTPAATADRGGARAAVDPAAAAAAAAAAGRSTQRPAERGTEQRPPDAKRPRPPVANRPLEKPAKAVPPRPTSPRPTSPKRAARPPTPPMGQRKSPKRKQPPPRGRKGR